MPITFIKIDLSDSAAYKVHELNEAISYLREARNKIFKIRQHMYYMQDGTDYSNIATAYGVSSSNADDLFLLIDGSLQALDNSGYVVDLQGRVVG